MSVLKSLQKTSRAYYVEASERIFLVCIKLVAKLHPRYFIILGQPLIETATMLKRECKLSNNLRADDLNELPERRKKLHLCQGYLEELISQLSTIETLTLSEGHELFVSAKNCNMSKDKAIDFVTKRIFEMLEDIEKLNKSLKSLIQSLNNIEVNLCRLSN